HRPAGQVAESEGSHLYSIAEQSECAGGADDSTGGGGEHQGREWRIRSERGVADRRVQDGHAHVIFAANRRGDRGRIKDLRLELWNQQSFISDQWNIRGYIQ